MVLTVCIILLVGFFAHSPEVRTMPALNREVGHGQHIAYNYPEGVGDEVIAYLDSAGVERVRLTMTWNDAEPNPDEYHWYSRGLDSTIIKLTDAGIKVLMNVWGTPDWLWDSACAAEHPETANRCPPENSLDSIFYDELEEFVYLADSHYDAITPNGNVSDWELWNEPVREVDIAGSTDPTSGGFWRGTVDQIDSMIVHFHNGLDAAGADNNVWCCASSFGHDGAGDNDWTAKTVDNLSFYIDGVSFHAYDSATTITNGQRVVDFMIDLLSDLDNVGHGSLPIINTEMGMLVPDSGGNFDTEDAQPEDVRGYMNNVFDSMAEYPEWKATFWFFWNRRGPLSSTDTDKDSVAKLQRIVNSGGGILNVDSVRYVSYCNLVARAGNHGSGTNCPSVWDITGHEMFVQEVPPNTDCIFSSNQDTGGGMEPYAWDWWVAGQSEGSGEWLEYRTPSSGSFTVKVRVTDDNGAQDEYEETMTVASGAMCTE